MQEPSHAEVLHILVWSESEALGNDLWAGYLISALWPPLLAHREHVVRWVRFVVFRGRQLLTVLV